jgi:transcription elongation factor GreA-like protein
LLDDLSLLKANEFEEYLRSNYEKQLQEFISKREPKPAKFIFKELISNLLPSLKWILKGTSLHKELKDKKDFTLLTS